MTQKDDKECWEQPQQGTIKVNIDAAIFEKSRSYCVSMVAHDHRGELVTATSSCRKGHIAPELAEAIRIKEVLSWVKNMIIESAIVETDYLSVVQSIRCFSVNLSYLGRVVDECKLLVKALKSSCDVELC